MFYQEKSVNPDLHRLAAVALGENARSVGPFSSCPPSFEMRPTFFGAKQTKAEIRSELFLKLKIG
jgi:hypothetical protein